MKQPYYYVKLDFSKHIAERNGDHINFGIPNSGMERIQYRIIPNTAILVVYGDYGYAVYNWYRQSITFEQINTMDIGYFESKCVASEDGRRFREWYPEKAYAQIFERILECCFTEDGDVKSKYEEEFDFDITYNNLVRYIENTFEIDNGHAAMNQNIYNYKYAIFDCDDYDFGWDIARRCYIHLEGLKTAMKQLEMIK